MKNLYCLFGPSASGKTEIAKYLEKNYGIHRVRSCTTRLPRYAGESDYIFVSPEEFSKLEPVYAYGEYAGDKYGVPPQELNARDLYIVEPSGIERLKSEYAERKIILLYLHASAELCEKRMKKRGDNPYNIKKRLKLDATVFEDAFLIADNVFAVNEDVTIEQLAKEVYTEMCYHEASTASNILQMEFPRDVISVQVKAMIDGELKYVWFDGETYSSLFDSIDDVVNDAEKVMGSERLKVLHQINARVDGVNELVQDLMEIIPIHQRFKHDGDLSEAKEYFGNREAPRLLIYSNLLDDLLNDGIAIEDYDVLYGGFIDMTFLFLTSNNRPIE